MSGPTASPAHGRPAGAVPEGFVAGYLPPGVALELPCDTRELGPPGHRLTLCVPRADAAAVSAAAQAVAAARRDALASLPVLAIVDAIDRAVARMLDPADPGRQAADALLPAITGFDADMVREGLNAALKGFRRAELLRWLTEEFGDPALLDDFRPCPRGAWSRAYGPALVGHVWAGNVPGLPFWSLVSGLLVKAGCIGKVASDEPWAAGWFARTLAEVEPRLAGTMAILWWPGGDADCHRALAQATSPLIVYGGESTIAAWRALAPATTRLLPHGHKLSAAIVTAPVLDTRQAQAAARLAALDVARWDQQGCYSPQMIYVERGAQVGPRDFAQLLAGELAAASHRFARRSLDLADAQAVAKWRQGWARAALTGAVPPGADASPVIEVLGASAAPWGVVYLDRAADGAQRPPGQAEADPRWLAGLAPSALNRTICVIAVDDADDAVRALAAHGPWLQTIAVAAPPPRLFALAARLGDVGATRICALGAAALPEPGWHHDGRFPLLDLVRMVDLEAGAEQAAESFTAYRE